MPRKGKRRSRSDEEHSHLAIRVERHEASVEAGINHNVYAPQSALDLDETDPLHEYTSRLLIFGTAIDPPHRAGEPYEITVYGEDDRTRRMRATLADVQARNEFGTPQYRPYRGRHIPVFRPPGGLGLLDKVRGERRWTAAIFVTSGFVSDALALLARGDPLFVAIHECRTERARWVRRLTLQTTDPQVE